jgi:hypothetical protein
MAPPAPPSTVVSSAAWPTPPHAAGPPSGASARWKLPVLVAMILVALAGAVAAMAIATTGSHTRVVTETPVQDESAPTASAEEPKPQRETTDVRYDRGAYSLVLPRGWTAGARSVDHGAYIESRWHPQGEPDVTVLVDHTPGFSGTAEKGASAVRAQVSRARGYREISYGPETPGDRELWRWEFVLRGERKVDWFLMGCDTGYALLGQAPTGTFDDHADAFAQAASSLRPTC